MRMAGVKVLVKLGGGLHWMAGGESFWLCVCVRADYAYI